MRWHAMTRDDTWHTASSVPELSRAGMLSRIEYSDQIISSRSSISEIFRVEYFRSLGARHHWSGQVPYPALWAPGHSIFEPCREAPAGGKKKILVNSPQQNSENSLWKTSQNVCERLQLQTFLWWLATKHSALGTALMQCMIIIRIKKIEVNSW